MAPSDDFEPNLLSEVAKMKPQILVATVRLGWAGGEGVTINRMLACGALVWGIFSAIYLLSKGIVLDEVILPAQILTGSVRYPAGHPHQIFFTQAYSLAHFLAAGLWKLEPDPLFISAIMNFLFIFSTTFVPFALTVLLTRQPFWGHLASTLTLSEGLMYFQGVYPIAVFPGFYSHAPIDELIALLTIGLLAAGLWRAGGLLLGFMPSIHPAMAVVVWTWTICNFVLRRNLLRRQVFTRLIATTSVGLTISALLAAITLYQGIHSSLEPPYDVQTNGELIYQQFVAVSNVHTQLFSVISQAYLVNPLVFFAIGALMTWNFRKLRGNDSQSPSRVLPGILLLGGMVWMCVYGARLYQMYIGSLPFYISALKPFRYSNLTAWLLIPLTVAAIAYAKASLSEKARLVALALVIGLILVEGIFIRFNRLDGANALFFIAWGILLAMDAYAHSLHPRRLLVSFMIVIILGGVLLLLFQTMQIGFWFVLSFLASYALFILSARVSQIFRPIKQGWGLWLHAALLFGCAMTCVVAIRWPNITEKLATVYDESGNAIGRWDAMSQYDRDLKKWLATNVQSDEMILPFILPRTELQAKTGHPVLFEMESLFLMDFIPRLASPIGTMARDLYGVDYGDPNQSERLSSNGRLELYSPVWLEIWKNRKRSEWDLLSKKYNFRLVLSLTNTPLDLPVALPGPFWTLYEIP